MSCERCDWLTFSAVGMLSRDKIADDQNFKELRRKYLRIFSKIEKNCEEREKVLELMMNSYEFLSPIKDETLKHLLKTLSTQKKTIKVLSDGGDDYLRADFKKLLLAENKVAKEIVKYITENLHSVLEKQKEFINNVNSEIGQVSTDNREDLKQFFEFERQNFPNLKRRNSF